MTRSPNGLKDDAFENHAQKTAPKNDAPNTMLRKPCPPGVAAKPRCNHSGTASREIAIFLIFRKN